jgi:hypothetical protein
VRSLVYPADVMPLSMYDVRGDAVIFQPNGDMLRLFENNGLATMWRLELPPGANELDLNQLVDVQLVLAFDAFFDPALETSVKASLPTTGNRAKATSLRLVAPDELFFLRRQGEATVPFSSADFPRNETNRSRTRATLKLTGDAAVIGGLVLRVAPHGGAPLAVTTAADGTVAGSVAGDPLGALLGGDPAVAWEVTAAAADNPGKPAAGDAVDLQGLTDLQIYQEYSFGYR